ncbi:YjeJ family protein [Klebsiella pneumoniae]|uniref:YjeJ family protein n=1 Tax=Klebsiella pneumoniae TaxID=573 RepID=UPI001882A438|nr:YjeJ family protein [Klebsiella pneumoniae]MBE8753666.1 hypothetical protein [Klebsiella pneumoniae]MBE8758614.1 hypothetical protein [Klebsiella pneumoniae]
MISTVLGFNTAIIKQNDNFLALALKIKRGDNTCQTYYLQYATLNDLLIILNNQMQRVAHRLIEQGESYREQFREQVESYIKTTPQIEAAEVQSPEPGRRIISLTLKTGKTESTLIAMLQSEQIDIIKIDDMQAELMLLAIRQAFLHAGAEEFISVLESTTDFLMLYAVEIIENSRFSYEQFDHESWKRGLFSHHLAILYCYETEKGKQILSGAVIKTNTPHPSELENGIAIRINERFPKLKSTQEKYPLCQIFSKVIPSSDNMDTLDACLQPLKAFFLEEQAKLDF